MNTDCNPCGTYFTTEELINQTVICDGGSVSFQVVGMGETPFVCNNILLNTSFEDWTEGVADNWNGAVQSEIAHTGSYSILVNNSDTYQEFIATTECLTLDFWHNTSERQCGGYYIQRFIDETQAFLQSDGTWGEDFYTFSLLDTLGEWVNTTLSFYSTIGLHYFIGFYSESDCNCYVDDVKICDACENIPT